MQIGVELLFAKNSTARGGGSLIANNFPAKLGNKRCVTINLYLPPPPPLSLAHYPYKITPSLPPP